MNTTLVARSDAALIAPLPAALEAIARDLRDLDASVHALSAFDAPLREFFKEVAAASGDAAGNATSDPDTVLVFGRDESTCPLALTKSLALAAMQQVLQRWMKELQVLEEAEDKKLAAWIRRKLGDTPVTLNSRHLTLDRASKVSDEMIGILRLAGQTIAAPPPVRQALAQGSGEAEGAEMFVRDLAQALEADSRLGALLRDLWDAASPADVDAVLGALNLADSDHLKPVVFYATLIKNVLELPEADRLRVRERCLSAPADARTPPSSMPARH